MELVKLQRPTYSTRNEVFTQNRDTCVKTCRRKVCSEKGVGENVESERSARKYCEMELEQVQCALKCTKSEVFT